MSHRMIFQSGWAKRVGPWFERQWPPNAASHKLCSASFVDAVVGPCNDLSIRISTHPWPDMLGSLRRSAKVHEPYSYQFADTNTIVYIGRRTLDIFGSRNRKHLYIGCEEIDRVTGCEPTGTMPLLQWYGGIFDTVFIALHPFNGPRMPNAPADSNSWSAVCSELGLGDIGEIEQRLSYRFELGDPSIFGPLQPPGMPADDWYPADSEFGAIMLGRYCTMLDELSLDEVVVTHYREDAEKMPVCELRRRAESLGDDNIFLISRLTATDRAFTIGVYPQRRFSVIAGNADVIERFRLHTRFEGFYASAATTGLWWLPPGDFSDLLKEQKYAAFKPVGARLPR